MKEMIRTCLCITVLTFSLFNALALLAAGSGYFGSTTQQGQEQTVEVKIDNFSFSPAILTVAAGTTVTWINRDDIPHTVVSSDDQEYSNPRRWTRTTGFHSPSRGPELIRISAPFTQSKVVVQ
jgi:plastocyanin